MTRTISGLSFLGLACGLALVFYLEHYKWRNCFNELGRCFDEDTGVVYLEQSGLVWLALALLALGAGLYQVLRPRKSNP